MMSSDQSVVHINGPIRLWRRHEVIVSSHISAEDVKQNRIVGLLDGPHTRTRMNRMNVYKAIGAIPATQNRLR